MEKRTLGKTGLDVSILGFGGFHQLEIPEKKVHKLLNYYLDHGGNYVETAAEYGHGEAERKMGPVVGERREEMVLASKTHKRDKSGAEETLNNSLERLQTDYLDVLFMHHVGDKETLDEILSPGGAMEMAQEAKEEGVIKNIGISMHGQPDILLEAVETGKFDVVMAVFNYFDRFNFPKLEDELLPLAQKKDLGIVLMKPIADGFLWRSAEKAFRYAFSLPVSVVATGMNDMEMMKKDIEFAENFTAMSEEEKQELFMNAPELGNYVCRQCDECYDCPEDIDIKEIFKLEGYYDRQMRDGKPRNPEKFALRDRLRFWFGNDDMAKELYQDLEVKADQCTDCGECISHCPYDLPIMEKLDIAHYKLGEDESLF